MESRQILIVSLLLVLTIGSSHSHNCNPLIVKESEGLLNYLANVTFTIPMAVDGDWTLDMETDVPFTFIGVSLNFKHIELFQSVGHLKST